VVCVKPISFSSRTLGRDAHRFFHFYPSFFLCVLIIIGFHNEVFSPLFVCNVTVSSLLSLFHTPHTWAFPYPTSRIFHKSVVVFFLISLYSLPPRFFPLFSLSLVFFFLFIPCVFCDYCLLFLCYFLYLVFFIIFSFVFFFCFSDPFFFDLAVFI